MYIKPRIEAILYDWDGTLYSSIELMWEGVCHVLKEYGITPPTLAHYAKYCIAPYIEYYRRLGCDAPEDDIRSKYWEYVHPRYHTLALFPSVPRMLRTQSNMYRLGIVSANYTVSIHQKLTEQSLLRVFTLGVFGELPYKAGLLQEMMMAGRIQADTTVFVGDTPSDMRCAREAGIEWRIGISHGLEHDDELYKHGATKVVHNHDELEESLCSGHLSRQFVS